MQISKNSDEYILIKDVLKNTNRCKEYTVSDDLQVLKIALEFDLDIELLLYSNEENYQSDTKILLDKLIKKAKKTFEISNKVYESLRLKDNHAGIIALIKLKNYTPSDFKNMDFVLVLDRLEIPGNLGTIYRTCDSAKVSGIILVDEVTKMNNLNVTSSSRGCNLIIPTISMSYTDTQEFLLENNYNIYLGEPELGKNYQEYDYKEKLALVMGNERFGINKKWYNNKHKEVYIPMSGNQNSLNVSVATSILVYEIYMKKYIK